MRISDWSSDVCSSDLHVLQLVAETVGTAGLVVGGARPHPAAQRLVQQPAVEQQVHAAIGRAHLHGAEDVVPLLRGCLQHDIEIGLAVAPYQFARGIGVLCVAEQQHDFVLAVGWQFDVGLQRAAGVKPRAGASCKRLPVAQRRGCGQVAVAAEEAEARSEEHTSELQSLMRISYAVFCLKKKNNTRIKYKINKHEYNTIMIKKIYIF